MKAAVFGGVGQIEMRSDVVRPTPGANEVLVKVAACGICGSDLHIYRAQTASSESLTVMESRLSWLATIAAVSPFVGLFGTIMGIVDAFHGLGQAGSATLRAVAPGVSEALITTAAGLVVAVPAVVAYNQFTARCRDFAARMDDFARELLNSMEEVALKPGQEPIEREAARGLHQ